MHFRHTVILLLLCFALPISSSKLHARPWTDSNGKVLDAKFVRIENGQVTLRTTSGKIYNLSITELSEADQNYIKESLSTKGIRLWTDNTGKQITARFVRIRDTTIYLESGGKTQGLEFSNFCLIDQKWIRARAVELGVAQNLPDLNDEAEEFTESTNDGVMSSSRSWIDKSGRKLEGRFESILENGNVLITSSSSTVVIHVSRLSEDDHDYLRNLLKNHPLAYLIPTKAIHLNNSPPNKPVLVKNQANRNNSNSNNAAKKSSSNSSMEYRSRTLPDSPYTDVRTKIARSREELSQWVEKQDEERRKQNEKFDREMKEAEEAVNLRSKKYMESHNRDIMKAISGQKSMLCQTCNGPLSSKNQASGECSRCKSHSEASGIKPFADFVSNYSGVIVLILVGIVKLVRPFFSNN
ncbi:MAG: hypothetical protein COA78_32770 [Blastopirellula sp.]|nr:MAG: hypothetical protein COA78_32770 [Blastopirellula sp.]